jgi:hypothetical protein
LLTPIRFDHENYFLGAVTISAALWIVGILNAQFVRDYLARAPRLLDEAVNKIRPEAVPLYSDAINAHSRFAVVQNRVTVSTYFTLIQTVMIMGLLALFSGLPVWCVRLAALWTFWAQMNDIAAIRRVSRRVSDEIKRVANAPSPSWFSKLNSHWDEPPRRFRNAVDYVLLVLYISLWLAPPGWIPFVFFIFMPLGIWAATSIIINSVMRVLEATPMLNLLRYPDPEHIVVARN